MTHWTDQLFREQSDLFAEWLEQRVEGTDQEVADLLEVLDAERDLDPDSVLDLACGIGRHVLAFADAGCRAEGVDFSADFVERGRERAEEAGLTDRVAFHHGDVRDLDEWDRTYDLITLFWNSLGYYDRATDREILADARSLLTTDGALVVEMSNKDYTLLNFEESKVTEREGELVVQRVDHDPATGRRHTTVDRFESVDDGYEHVATTEFNPRLYAPVELRELCADAGFDRVELFGGYDGTPVTLDDPRVLAVAD